MNLVDRHKTIARPVNLVWSNKSLSSMTRPARHDQESRAETDHGQQVPVVFIPVLGDSRWLPLSFCVETKRSIRNRALAEEQANATIERFAFYCVAG